MPKKKLNNKSITIEIELYAKDNKQMLFIASDNSSGCEYEVKTFADVGKCVADYIEFYAHD